MGTSELPSSKKVVKRSGKVSAKPGKVTARVTYATMKITPDDDRAYDSAVEKVRSKLGARFAMYINGEHWASTGEETPHASPVDTRLIVSHFPKGTRDDVKSAIDAARDAYPEMERHPLQRACEDPPESRRPDRRTTF